MKIVFYFMLSCFLLMLCQSNVPSSGSSTGSGYPENTESSDPLISNLFAKLLFPENYIENVEERHACYLSSVCVVCYNISNFWISKSNKFQCNEEYIAVHITFIQSDSKNQTKKARYEGTAYLKQYGEFEPAQKLSEKCLKIRRYNIKFVLTIFIKGKRL